MTRKVYAVLGSALALVWSCAAGAPNYSPNPGGQDAGSSWTGPECYSAKDCPTGFTCEANRCRPPEVEKDRTLTNRPPSASPHYVYALNPTADAVARVDPTTLAIEAIPVPAGPRDLTALSAEDVAVVLSTDDPAVTVVDSTSLPSRTFRLQLKRRCERLAVSADGRWAVAYPDPSTPPTDGAAGLVTLVDLQALRGGAPVDKARLERAAGYRVTDVLFRLESGRAVAAYAVAKDTLSVLDLADPAGTLLPRQVRLPASMSADVSSREVVATADGANVMLRSTTAAELAWFDGVEMRTVALPEVATDLDLMPDGTVALAALRAAEQLAIIDVPGDLFDPAGIELLAVAGGVGQVVVPRTEPAGGSFALAYSNAGSFDSFLRVDLPGGEATAFPLQKLVQEIDLSPDGAAAVIVHRPEPDSAAADPYEKAVDLAQGYTVYDARTGYLQLKTTGSAEPGPFAFSPAGRYVAVAVRGEGAAAKHALDVVDLEALVPTTLSLASAPLFLGPVPQAQGASPHRVFVSQDHPAGRISVVTLDTLQLRTATGFTLNAEIE